MMATVNWQSLKKSYEPFFKKGSRFLQTGVKIFGAMVSADMKLYVCIEVWTSHRLIRFQDPKESVPQK
jgi:hypothetical protein